MPTAENSAQEKGQSYDGVVSIGHHRLGDAVLLPVSRPRTQDELKRADEPLQLRPESRISRLLRAIPTLRGEGEKHYPGLPGNGRGQGR